MGHPSTEAQAPVKEKNLNLGRNVQNVDRDVGGSLEMDCEQVCGGLLRDHSRAEARDSEPAG